MMRYGAGSGWKFFPWLAVVALALLLGTGGAAGAGPKPPNVLFILIDDLGYEGLSANGSASYHTPNLDHLAAGGARFTEAYAQPLCTPTRVQLMTGRYNFRNYVRFGTLPKGEKTFAQMLKDAGYATGVSGKWQLDEENGQQPDEAGFDDYCLWNFNRGDLKAQGDRYADANMIYLDPQTRQPVFHRCEGDYGPDFSSRYMLDFMERSVRAGKPFLAYYPMILTHHPFEPTPHSAEWQHGDRHQRGVRYFKDMVEYTDVLVGQALHKLDELGVRDNTLVLVMGDNGTHTSVTSQMKGGRLITGGKGRLTDAGTHVPLLAYWRGTIPAGQVRNELIDSTDLLPTLAEATGAKPEPAAGDGKLDGRSFLGMVKGEKFQPRDWVLMDFRAEMAGEDPKWDGRAIRDQRWKLYGYGRNGSRMYQSGQLFDMKADPEERSPVAAGNREGDAARQRLQAVLDQMALEQKTTPRNAARGRALRSAPTDPRGKATRVQLRRPLFQP